jgi:hypothetical protein
LTIDDSAAAAARQLELEGWNEIDSGADAATLAHIQARYDALIDEPATSVDLGMHPRPDAVRHVIDPVGHIPEIAGLFTEHVADVARAAFGTHVAITTVRLWRTIHIPDADLMRVGGLRRRRPVSVMANLFHNDQHPVSTLKYFVQLTPGMSADTGALQLLPISATKRIVRSGFLRPDVVLGPASRLIRRTHDVIEFDGPPGAGLICNSERCLHRAAIPAPGRERAMIQFMLTPSAVPLPPNWPHQLAPDQGVDRATSRAASRLGTSTTTPSGAMRSVAMPSREPSLA